MKESHPLYKFMKNYTINDEEVKSQFFTSAAIDQLPYVQLNKQKIPEIPNMKLVMDYGKEVSQHGKLSVQINFTTDQKKKQWQLLQQLLSGISIDDYWDQAIQFNNNAVVGKGLSCSGVLACLNSHYIKHIHYLMRHQNKNNENSTRQEITQLNCVVAAISDILLKISQGQQQEKKNVIVVSIVPSSKIDRFPLHPNCLQFNCISYTNVSELYTQLHNYRDQFIKTRCFGLLLFLYSCIYTKNPQNILEESDSQAVSLFNHKGVANQELINLLLTGTGTSNCFNEQRKLQLQKMYQRNKVLDESFIMKGVSNKQEIGYLSLNEYQRYLSVGSFFKTPMLPIWVIYDGATFSTVYGWNAIVLKEERGLKEFDLIWNQHYMGQPVVLKVMRFQNQKEAKKLEQVLSTKWGKNLKIEERTLCEKV